MSSDTKVVHEFQVRWPDTDSTDEFLTLERAEEWIEQLADDHDGGKIYTRTVATTVTTTAWAEVIR